MGSVIVNSLIHDMAQVNIGGGDYDVPYDVNDGIYVGTVAGDIKVETYKGTVITFPVTAYMTVHLKCKKIYQVGTTATDLYVFKMVE